jgi:hypothetical protein
MHDQFKKKNSATVRNFSRFFFSEFVACVTWLGTSEQRPSVRPLLSRLISSRLVSFRLVSSRLAGDQRFAWKIEALLQVPSSPPFSQPASQPTSSFRSPCPCPFPFPFPFPSPPNTDGQQSTLPYLPLPRVGAERGGETVAPFWVCSSTREVRVQELSSSSCFLRDAAATTVLCKKKVNH